jgi:septum formation protein
MIEFLLASASPRRSQILENLGIKFRLMIPPDITEDDEMLNIDLFPYEKAIALARKKSLSVNPMDNQLVLTADTIVAVDNETYGKPENDDQARYFLKKLSGRKHQVITALALRKGKGDPVSDFESTDVYFTKMSDSDIDWYISTKEPFGKAGAYAIQEKGGIFIEKIEGCYFNVVGLPVFCLMKLLKQTGCYQSVVFGKMAGEM